MNECLPYSPLLELTSPKKVGKVSLDSIEMNAEICIPHEKGVRLLSPVCKKECNIYDQKIGVVSKYLYSIDFITFMYACSPSISVRIAAKGRELFHEKKK
jgi:hypothetical protein